jgi:hypothetical protein
MAYMSYPTTTARRSTPRVSLDALYCEYVAERQQLGMIVDVSERGLRVQRLLRRSGSGSRIVQLEFELPGTQEQIWAKGEICFDELWQPKREPGSSPRVVQPLRTSGIRLVAAATKHFRLLRDYVIELRQAMDPSSCLMFASSYRS